MELQAQAQLDQQRISLQGQQEMQNATYEHQLQIAVLSAQQANERFKMAQQAALAGAPKISLTGALGPVGIPAAEKLAGLPETDSSNDLKQAALATAKAKTAVTAKAA